MTLTAAARTVYAWISSRFLPASVVVGAVSLWMVTPQSVVFVAGLSGKNGVAACTALSRVPDALDLIREERERTAAERDAFDAFARRVAALEPVTSPGPGSAGGTAGGHSTVVAVDDPVGGADPALDDVREAYRETVMAVVHYDEEYAEPLAENMRHEFGPELSEAVAGNDSLTPQLQAALVEAGRQARDQRASFLRRLDGERASVADAKESFRETLAAAETIEASLHERSSLGVGDAWERLNDIEDDCKEQLAERQRRVHRASGAVTSPPIQDYLYVSREWTYPVLGDGLDCLDRVDEVKQRVTAVVLEWT